MRPVKRDNPTDYIGGITLDIDGIPVTNQSYKFLPTASLQGLTQYNRKQKPTVKCADFTISLTAYQAGVSKAKLIALTGTGNKKTNAKKAVEQYLDTGGKLGIHIFYPYARGDLIRNFGQYCSYCEMPVLDSRLDVEHTLPKSSFPDEATVYENLLISCPNCNSAYKKDYPDMNFLLQWAGSTGWLPGTTAEYMAVKNVGYNYYMWPFYKDAYRTYEQELRYNPAPPPLGSTNTAWGASSTLVMNPFDRQNRWIATTGAQVFARIPTISATADISVGVEIIGTVPIPALGSTAPISHTNPPNLPQWLGGIVYNPSSEVMINKYNPITGNGLLGLNAYPISDNFGDRRLVNRTEAWFKAIEAFDHLQQYITNGGAATYPIFFDQVLSNAVHTGFYSTWVTVFNALAGASATPPVELPLLVVQALRQP